MSERIDDVAIVGGGDSGLLTALSIQQLNPGIDVSVVDDFQQDVPQVGKSTYLAIQNILHDSLDIDEQRFVSQVKPVWKASVYFKDWCDYPEFHYPFDVANKFPPGDKPDLAEYYYYFYDEVYSSHDHRTKCEEMVAQGKSPWYYSVEDGGQRKYNNVAYHLNTERFNSFLRKLSRKRGISLIDDEVVGVETTGSHVDRVRSKSQSYEADLYVDATGFNRVLKGELDSDYRAFDIPLDSAFNTRVENSLEDVVPATVIETGDHGWFWQIDTYDNRDLGYVFASDSVSDEEAKAEFLEHCGDGASEDDVAKYTFDSGYFERAWEGNCVTIGNAQGFVEPLQSTGLTANAQAALTLSNLLSAHGRFNDDGIRDDYNAWVSRSWESIYDFISIHYRFASGETEFWERMQSIDVSDRVEHFVREFDRNGFDTTVDPTRNYDDIPDPMIFRPRNYFMLIRNMGATSELYESNDFEVSDEVKAEEDEYYQEIREEVADHHTTRELYKGILQL